MKKMDFILKRKRSHKVLSWSAGLALSFGGSLLLALSFSPLGCSFVAWIAMLPLFCAVCLFKRAQAVLNALISGVVFYLLMYAWMQRFHRFAVIFIAVLFGLLFFSLPLLLIRLWVVKKPSRGVLFAPALWVIFEYLKLQGPLSFGFGIMGYSQYQYIRMIQIADLTGVFGLSFLVVLVNFSLFRLVQLFFSGERFGVKTLSGPASAVVLVLLAAGYGQWCLSRPLDSLVFTVQLNQFNHDASLSWAQRETDYMEEYADLAMTAASFAPDLLIYPENAVKRYVSVDKAFPVPGSSRILNRLSSIAARRESSLLLGVLERAGEEKRYNSAFLFDSRGDLTGRYRKQHLVPFGEVDPFSGGLPGLEKLLENETDVLRLDRGGPQPPLTVYNRNGQAYQMGVLICFESTLGDLARYYNGNGEVDFLVNITSDAWTGSPAALEQHAAFSVFRAVENRRTLYRAGNGGVTCVVNPKGVIIRKLPYFTRGVLLSGLTIPVSRNPSFYNRWGDWIVLLALALVLLSSINPKLIPIFKKRRR